jgi:hypothetical protein
MMGYFPNSTEGEMYQEMYCDRCIHGNGDCAVWLAHELRNYDDCNNPQSILHMLIPRTEDGLENKRCLMFADASGYVRPTTGEDKKAMEAIET